ncbi:MAG: hypothetical protein ACREIV_03600, partial [Planctomycetaceae bacterium]
SGTVPAGGLFTVQGTGDEGLYETDPAGNRQQQPSQIVLDFEYPATNTTPIYDDVIAPASTTTPRLDLVNGLDPTGIDVRKDRAYRVVTPNVNNNFQDPGGPSQDGMQFLSRAMFASGVGAAPPTALRFTLERRLHPDWPFPSSGGVFQYDADYEISNPWVAIDEWDVLSPTVPEGGFATFRLSDNQDTGPLAQTALQNQGVNSTERGEPLNRTVLTPHPLGAPVMNTLGADNRVNVQSGQPFQLYEAPRDRDFANAAELFTVPMFSPRDTTDKTRLMNQTPLNQINNQTPSTPPAPRRAVAAEGRFLLTQHPEQSGFAAHNLDSRWHRLLGFLEVPTLQNSFDSIRQAGRINWNTIRYPEVWAGLIDDDTAFDTFTPLKDSVANQTQYILHSTTEPARDWWVQFIHSRDGFDPVTGLYMPATAVARPFRSFTHLPDATTGAAATAQVPAIESTMLRSLPLDDADNDPFNQPDPNARRLLELGTQSARHNYDLRHRILGKTLGNSTTRSHVLFVFVQIDYFEVVEHDFDGDPGTPPALRIGAKLQDTDPDVPTLRRFYVVDRSRAFLELQNGLADGQNDFQQSLFTLGESFDHNAVILHEHVIE